MILTLLIPRLANTVDRNREREAQSLREEIINALEEASNYLRSASLQHLPYNKEQLSEDLAIDLSPQLGDCGPLGVIQHDATVTKLVSRCDSQQAE